ncbi:Pumilio domain-containing protein C6G9.14 [Galdieria sulphuraria]|uniref:Serine rich Pumilio family RNA binding domain protein n=1 Tax=Galdieria sulphuraria TaxID=130081 RepID=M2W0G8_GALSU|nr:serine rich Pumilio family RNA binding domain protein [Galdieria sulphuraria]EME29106.1 serine rich Pumilio family RNA binding domain protein [Galdieria sulphuraria]GJD12691.1 Pumilio domain-containing protein C6G9.14 [Galdieria sulphuraria]|eukprot:XP_005705626.1 serine rich Pumilio family RNA binding domain protein [Galdieria sulphuraria]
MNVGLKPMVDLTMQDYSNPTLRFQDDVGGAKNANSISPETSTLQTGSFDPRTSPMLFSLSPDWKSSDYMATSEVEVSLEKEEQPQSLSAPEYEYRHSVLLPLKQTEAYSAPSNLQIQSHSLFAFRASYSGAFLSTADDLHEQSSSNSQPGLGLESSTNVVERSLRRQDSDASVDDLIFREWRKMRPRTSLLRDDSMASLASLPRTESEISIDGERIHLDEGIVSNLKIDAAEDSSHVEGTFVLTDNNNNNIKEYHENIACGSEKQHLPMASLYFGSSAGVLNPIIEQDSHIGPRSAAKGPLWEQASWNGMYMQGPINSGPLWSESFDISNVQSNSSLCFEGDISSSLSRGVSSSSPSFLDNSKLLGNCRNDSISLQSQNAVIHSSMPCATLSNESEPNLFYRDGLKPTTAAAAAAIASAASAANKSVPRTVKSHSMTSEIFGNLNNLEAVRGMNANYLSSTDSSHYSSISSSHSWVTTNSSLHQNPMLSGNNYRKNIIPFSVSPSTGSISSLTGNVSTSKVWSMEEIVGRIFELAKDQHGCRFLQMKLEEGNPAYIAMILAECFDGLPELMVDPFGNYLCQKLFECCNFQQRLSILQNTCSVLAQVSMNMHGTRVVQRIIECMEGEDQISTVCTALTPFASQLMKDVNGNHVIQRCLQKVAPTHNQFIFDAVVSHCVELATHRHGCCVIQRCLDYAIPLQKEQVCMEICENAFTLVQDAFGNYVVQYVLDLKNRFYIAKIIAQLAGHLYELSVQKFSSNVVEKCLQQVDPETRKHLIYELMSDRELLGRLLHDAYGNYVVQRALQLAQSPQLEQFCEIIRPHLSSLKSTPYGKRIYSKIVRRFPESCS